MEQNDHTHPSMKSHWSHFQYSAPGGIGGSLWVENLQKIAIPEIQLISGSKSFTNRSLVLAGMTRSPVTLEGVLFSDDSFWGLNSLANLGFQVQLSPSLKRVNLIPPESVNPNTTETSLYLGQAGTLARFFPAVILNFEKVHGIRVEAHLLGHAQLMGRPLAPLLDALRQWGVIISGNSLPLKLVSTSLSASAKISGAKSGQFLSGLLLAGASQPNPLELERVENLVQPDYVRMTIESLEAFGARLESDSQLHRFRLGGGLLTSPGVFQVEPDASTLCYFVLLAALLGFPVRFQGIGTDSLQPDVQFCKMIKQLGAPVECLPNEIRVLSRWEEHPKGNRPCFNMELCSDQALTMGILGLLFPTGIKVTGVAHIRHHESDRIASFCQNAKELGAQVWEMADGFEVGPLPTFDSLGSPKLWRTHHDHRFAMTGAILACLFPRQIGIEDPSCCQKTAPHFFKELESWGIPFSHGDFPI